MAYSIRPLRPFLVALVALLASLMPLSAVHGQGEARSGDSLLIATHEAPPFVTRDEEGEWHGLAIDLWRGIADDMGLSYRIEATDIDGMVSGVAEDRYDMSVGALTVTPSREQLIDFTHPYLTTGFGIAVRETPPGWLTLMGGFVSWGFLQAVLALGAVLLVVGLLFWLAERSRNAEEFGGKPAAGILSGFWFSAVTMTTVGYGDKAPRTALGKAIALVWMFAAIIIISTFTGMIASALTESRLAGQIRGAGDLPKVEVGSVGNSAAEEWLAGDGIGMRDFPDIDAGLEALRAGEIDAFVYDLPLLSHRLGESRGGIRLVPGSFGRQDYAFALPQESRMREALNLALLRHIDQPDWVRAVRRELGEE